MRGLNNSKEGLGDLKNLGEISGPALRGMRRSSLKSERTILLIVTPLSLMFAYSFIRLILWLIFS